MTNPVPLSRRDFLWQSGGDLGGVALASLLGGDRRLVDAPPTKDDFNGGLHYRPRRSALRSSS